MLLQARPLGAIFGLYSKFLWCSLASGQQSSHGSKQFLIKKAANECQIAQAELHSVLLSFHTSFQHSLEAVSQVTVWTPWLRILREPISLLALVLRLAILSTVGDRSRVLPLANVRVNLLTNGSPLTVLARVNLQSKVFRESGRRGHSQSTSNLLSCMHW